MTIVLVRNDKLFNLNFTVKNAAGTVTDLSNVTTITFKMKELNATTNKVSRVCSVTSAPAGTCYVTLQAADMDTSGTYRAEVELLYNDGKIITAEVDDVLVMDDLPNA